MGVIVGMVPCEELTGDPNLGNDLLEIALGFDDVSEVTEHADLVLIPYVEQIVPAVLLEQNLVLIDPPAGLLDIIQPKRTSRVNIRALIPQYAQSLRKAADEAPSQDSE